MLQYKIIIYFHASCESVIIINIKKINKKRIKRRDYDGINLPYFAEDKIRIKTMHDLSVSFTVYTAP